MANQNTATPISPGDKFGRWTVVGRAPSVIRPSGGARSSCRCRCACGAEHDVLTVSLRRGVSTQCVACANKTQKGRPQAPRLPWHRPTIVEVAATPSPPPAVPPGAGERPQTAALIREQPAGGRPAPTGFAWLDDHQPKCLRCAEPVLSGTGFCAQHTRHRYRHTAPDARHA